MDFSASPLKPTCTKQIWRRCQAWPTWVIVSNMFFLFTSMEWKMMLLTNTHVLLFSEVTTSNELQDCNVMMSRIYLLHWDIDDRCGMIIYFATYLSIQIQLFTSQTHPLLGCKLPTHPTRLTETQITPEKAWPPAASFQRSKSVLGWNHQDL